jgi:uncharacterized membrane protein
MLFLLFPIPALLAVAALAHPFLLDAGRPMWAFAVWQFFSVACHQDAARSFWLLGAPLAVCARCIGIYAGAAAGVWLRLPRRAALGTLAAMAALNAVDALLGVSGLGLRFALGTLLGGTAGALLGSAVRQQFSSAAKAAPSMRQ